MKTLNRLILATGVATLLGLSAGNASAQERPGRGNFDPEQFRQRQMERYREQLEVKNDDEWKIVSARIDKVFEARREVGFGGGFGRGGGGRRGEGNGGGATGGGDQGGDRERRSRFGGEPSPEAEALQKAIDSKASADEIKAKLAKYRESRKAKEAKLTAAQDELRKVLSVRQEAAAVMGGLLQ
jgi:hypothetical protein